MSNIPDTLIYIIFQALRENAFVLVCDLCISIHNTYVAPLEVLVVLTSC